MKWCCIFVDIDDDDDGDEFCVVVLCYGWLMFSFSRVLLILYQACLRGYVPFCCASFSGSFNLIAVQMLVGILVQLIACIGPQDQEPSTSPGRALGQGG